MKTERLEKIVACAFAFRFVALENALHENIRVHNSNDATLRIDHRECEELVEHEKLACFQNGRLRWQRDYARHHDLPQVRTRIGREQSASRNYANEAFLLIDGIKINDPFANTFTPDGCERFLHAGARFEQGKVFARVVQRRRVKIDRAGKIHRSTLCTIPLSRKIRAASPK